MQDKLRASIKPLHKTLIEKIPTRQEIYSFCMQWGKDFPTEPYSGILFVGKATNGWMSPSRDMEILFGNTNEGIFARKDRMEWVSKLEGNKVGYNSSKSAFWRVIKGTTQIFYGKSDWTSKIAWSNLYKASGEKGNPNSQLKASQKEICKRILEEEIRILCPKFVVFLTSDWESNFVQYLQKDEIIKWETKKWGKSYSARVGTIGKTVFIRSSHPQGKNEYLHVKVLSEIIKEYS